MVEFSDSDDESVIYLSVIVALSKALIKLFA